MFSLILPEVLPVYLRNSLFLKSLRLSLIEQGQLIKLEDPEFANFFIVSLPLCPPALFVHAAPTAPE